MSGTWEKKFARRINELHEDNDMLWQQLSLYDLSAETVALLQKWATNVTLENFIDDHTVMWRCCIGHLSAEDPSLAMAVKGADEMAQLESKSTLPATGAQRSTK